jgi:hypothetical protein
VLHIGELKDLFGAGDFHNQLRGYFELLHPLFLKGALQDLQLLLFFKFFLLLLGLLEHVHERGDVALLLRGSLLDFFKLPLGVHKNFLARCILVLTRKDAAYLVFFNLCLQQHSSVVQNSDD